MDEGVEGEERKDEEEGEKDDGLDADEGNEERDGKRDDDGNDDDEREGRRELDEPGRGGMTPLLPPAEEASDLPKIE